MNATANTSIAREPHAKRRSRISSPVILVATDGSETSRAAYAAAELIAAQSRARVHVLSVLEPIPAIVPPPGTPVVAAVVDRSREDALRTDMVEQLLKIGKLAKWTTEIRLGKPASVIANVAKDRKADLIIVGANRHGIVDRLLGEETAPHLAKLVDRPLLVASPQMERLPVRAIIGLDLVPADRSNLVDALDLFGAPQSVSVLHVEPRSEALGVDWAEYDYEYRAEIEGAFHQMKKILRGLPHVEADLVVMHGDPAREIISFAESVKAELIVLGVKHRPAFALAPGTAMRVIRLAGCSVLLVPNRDQ